MLSRSCHFECFTVTIMTQKYAPFVVITIQPYLHACMTYHRFVTTVTRRVPLVEQELITLSEHEKVVIIIQSWVHLHLIQPTISLEMPVPSQDHYGFHSFPVVD